MPKYLLDVLAEDGVEGWVNYAYVELDDQFKQFIKTVLDHMGALAARTDFLCVEFLEHTPTWLERLPPEWKDLDVENGWLALPDDTDLKLECARIGYSAIRIEDDRIIWSAVAKHCDHAVYTWPLRYRDIGWDDLIVEKKDVGKV